MTKQLVAHPCHFSSTGIALALASGGCSCRPMRLTAQQKIALGLFEPGLCINTVHQRTINVLEARGLIEFYRVDSNHRRDTGKQAHVGYRRTLAGYSALQAIRYRQGAAP